MRTPKPVLYEHDALPSDLVHRHQKLGRIPDCGGHRKVGRRGANRYHTRKGYALIHRTVDDHSRLGFSENLCDEKKKETALAFWIRANTYFNLMDIVVQRVLTDYRSCYRSLLFTETSGGGIIHKRTRPYRPQTKRQSRTVQPYV